MGYNVLTMWVYYNMLVNHHHDVLSMALLSSPLLMPADSNFGP